MILFTLSPSCFYFYSWSKMALILFRFLKFFQFSVKNDPENDLRLDRNWGLASEEIGSLDFCPNRLLHWLICFQFKSFRLFCLDWLHCPNSTDSFAIVLVADFTDDDYQWSRSSIDFIHTRFSVDVWQSFLFLFVLVFPSISLAFYSLLVLSSKIFENILF